MKQALLFILSLGFLLSFTPELPSDRVNLAESVLAEPGAASVSGTIMTKAKSSKGNVTYECGGEKHTAKNTSIRVSKKGGLANALVKVISRETKNSAKVFVGNLSVKISGAAMEPRVAVLKTGQSLSFTNTDKVTYNLMGHPKTTDHFNIGMPPSVTSKPMKFSKAEDAFQVKCDVHPLGYVAVMTHPYFGVTDDNGNFTIEGLEKGKTYEFEVWHESLGTAKFKAVAGEKMEPVFL